MHIRELTLRQLTFDAINCKEFFRKVLREEDRKNHLSVFKIIFTIKRNETFC